MANEEFAGSALYCEWVTSAGTLVLSTENRNFNYSEAGETIDATAGSDTTRRKISSFKSITASMTYTAQSGTAGTLLISRLQFGQVGTLVIGEAGTASNAPKTILPALCLGISRSVPYADVVTYDISWEANGTPTYAGWP